MSVLGIFYEHSMEDSQLGILPDLNAYMYMYMHKKVKTFLLIVAMATNRHGDNILVPVSGIHKHNNIHPNMYCMQTYTKL